MKTKCCKLVLVAAVSVVILGVAANADKCKDVLLPDAAKAAINALYPQAVIEESKEEKEGLKVYEVEFEQNGQEVELTISPDGKIIEKEAEVAMGDLPAAVKAAITKASKGGQVKEIEEEVTYYVVTLKKLKTPKVTYEAEIIIDGEELEVEFASDGKLLSKEVECDDDDDDYDD